MSLKLIRYEKTCHYNWSWSCIEALGSVSVSKIFVRFLFPNLLDTLTHNSFLCLFIFKIDPLTPTLRLVCPLFRWWVKDFVRCWTWGLAGIRNPTQTFLPSARLRRERARKKGRDISMTDWLVVSRNRSRNGCFRFLPNPQNTEFLANTKFQSYSLALC